MHGDYIFTDPAYMYMHHKQEFLPTRVDPEVAQTITMMNQQLLPGGPDGPRQQSRRLSDSLVKGKHNHYYGP